MNKSKSHRQTNLTLGWGKNVTKEQQDIDILCTDTRNFNLEPWQSGASTKVCLLKKCVICGGRKLKMRQNSFCPNVTKDPKMFPKIYFVIFCFLDTLKNSDTRRAKVNTTSTADPIHTLRSSCPLLLMFLQYQVYHINHISPREILISLFH